MGRYGVDRYGIDEYGRTRSTDEPAPFTVVSLSHTMFSNQGGLLVTASGLFPDNEQMRIYAGLTATANDEPCYGGFGNGYYAVSLDAETLDFVLPPFDFVSDSLYITFVYGDYSQSMGPYSILNGVDNSKVIFMTRSFPRWMKTRN
jgi:hypothetical protein